MIFQSLGFFACKIVKQQTVRLESANALQANLLEPTSHSHGRCYFLGKSTGVGCHFLLQGIFPTRGSNLGLLHCRQIFHHLSHQGIPHNCLNTWSIFRTDRRERWLGIQRGHSAFSFSSRQSCCEKLDQPPCFPGVWFFLPGLILRWGAQTRSSLRESKNHGSCRNIT